MSTWRRLLTPCEDKIKSSDHNNSISLMQSMQLKVSPNKNSTISKQMDRQQSIYSINKAFMTPEGSMTSKSSIINFNINNEPTFLEKNSSSHVRNFSKHTYDLSQQDSFINQFSHQKQAEKENATPNEQLENQQTLQIKDEKPQKYEKTIQKIQEEMFNLKQQLQKLPKKNHHIKQVQNQSLKIETNEEPNYQTFNQQQTLQGDQRLNFYQIQKQLMKGEDAHQQQEYANFENLFKKKNFELNLEPEEIELQQQRSPDFEANLQQFSNQVYSNNQQIPIKKEQESSLQNQEKTENSENITELFNGYQSIVEKNASKQEKV